MWENLRKFGLNHCDMPTMMWNISFMLRLVALNIDRRNDKSIPLIGYVFTLVSGTSYFYTYIISAYWFIFVWSPRSGDLLGAIVIFSLSAASSVGVTKLICVLTAKNTVRDLTDSYVASDAQVISDNRFFNNQAKTLRIVKKRAIIFFCVTMGNGIIYALKTILLPGRHSFVLLGLEPMSESPNYEIGVTVNAVSVFFPCYLLPTITGFFIIATGYTEAQMLALSEELTNLWDDAEMHYSKNAGLCTGDGVLDDNDNARTKDLIINNYIKHHLISVVKIHTTNLHLIRQVEKVFRVAIAVEFLLITSALIAILLGGLENTVIQLPYSLIVIGMDCVVGQKVADASFAFETAIYNCRWENFNTSNRKTVLLILQNAQKNVKMSAGGVATLNYVSFMTVIRSIYSAYAALRSCM